MRRKLKKIYMIFRDFDANPISEGKKDHIRLIMPGPWDNVEFKELPFDIMECIFQHLDIDDLKNLMVIDRYIREVIQTSPKTMRKLPLLLNENWNDKWPFVEEFGDFVKEANFNRTSFNTPVEFRNILSHMRNIETLKMSNLRIDAENISKPYKVIVMKFERMKCLHMDNSQAVTKLLKNLKKVQLKELKLDFCHLTPTSEFTDFFCSQRKLETLILAGWDNIIYKSLFCEDLVPYILFKIQKLIVGFRVTKNDFFLTFLVSQPELNTLEFQKEVLDEDLLNTIFKMKKVKKLIMRTNFASLRNIDLKKISQSNLSELRLITRSEYGIEQTINTLVSKLLNLKSLEIVNLKTDSSDQLLGFVHLKKLEKFYVENSKLKFIQNIKFDCLKRLHIEQIHLFLKNEDWMNFFKNNQNLEEFVVRGIECYYNIEQIKAEIEKFVYNIQFAMKKLRRFEIYQELRYQKPIKMEFVMENGIKSLKCSDAFIKHCREEFHHLRKLFGDDLILCYYADDNL